MKTLENIPRLFVDSSANHKGQEHSRIGLAKLAELPTKFQDWGG